MLAMAREAQGGTTAAAAAGKGGVGKKVLKVGAGIAGVVALVLALGEYAHPTPAGTTPDNPYGLTDTNVCDVYGQPIVRDFRGILWNRSTYTHIDLNNPPPLYQCPESQQALGGSIGAGVGAGYASQPQKRALHTKEFVSAIWSVR